MTLFCAAITFTLYAQDAASTSTTKVLIAGSGTEPYINTVIDAIGDHLKAAGITPLASDAKSRTSAVEAIKPSQTDSLLYVTVVLARYDRKMTVQCFDKDGKQLWEEHGSGGAMAITPGQFFKKLIEDLNKEG